MMLSQRALVEEAYDAVASQQTAVSPRAERVPPHVLMVVLAGCERGQLGCFGRSLETPVIDSLARAGLRFAAAEPCDQLPTPPTRAQLESSLSELNFLGLRAADASVVLHSEPGPADLPSARAVGAQRVAERALALIARVQRRSPERRMFLELEFDAGAHAELRHVDAELGRVISALERSGELGHTLVMLVASHPPEHRELLLMCWPDRIAGQGELRLRASHPFSVLATLLASYQRKYPRSERPTLRDVRPQSRDGNSIRKYIYHPASTSIPEVIPKRLLTRPHRISATIVTDHDARGTLLCHASVSGGYALYVEDRYLHYVLCYLGGRTLRLRSRELLPTGRCEVRLEYRPVSASTLAQTRRAPGRVRLLLGGRVQASVDMPLAMPLLLTFAGKSQFPNDERAIDQCFERAPFAFGYDLRRVAVEVEPELKIDARAEMQAILAESCR
jgi:hypothetical protein